MANCGRMVRDSAMVTMTKCDRRNRITSVGPFRSSHPSIVSKQLNISSIHRLSPDSMFAELNPLPKFRRVIPAERYS